MHRNLATRCVLAGAFALIAVCAFAGAVAEDPDGLADRRLDLMRSRIEQIQFRATPKGFPQTLEPEPLFRYDDLARRYVDGTVWRLGKEGRPLAIITAELTPDYYGAGPRIVYDFLSLTEVPFRATSTDVPGWTPGGSAVTTQRLPDGPPPAPSSTRRLFQMKQLAARFAATQEVDGEHLKLRLLPRPIDRYTPDAQNANRDNADAAIFLFVAGRMPGVLLVLETDGRTWQYGLGRLSGPSELTVTLDGNPVWKVPVSGYQWTQPYTASNSPAVIPGYEN